MSYRDLLLSLRDQIDAALGDAPAASHHITPAITQISTGGPRVEEEFAAGQARAYSFYHAGGVMELVVAVVTGKPGYNTLTDSLSGPTGWVNRPWTPAGTIKTHRAVDCVPMPPGQYTYTMWPDTHCWLGITKPQ